MTAVTAASHPIATTPLCVLAACTLVFQLLPLAIGQYGFFNDEFYYYACADRLDWGYVDHPPLSILLLWLVRSLFGDSLFAVRSVAAISGAATIFIGGMMAQRMGASPRGQVLSATAIVCTPILAVIFGFYSMNAFEVLIWSVCSLLTIEILLNGQTRLWWVLGIFVGLGFLNKHTMVLFIAGLAVGLLLTSKRRVLHERSLWIGVGVATAIALPNLLWQIQHDWISLEFYRNTSSKNAPTTPSRALLNQVLSFNPGSLPIWGAGVWLLLRQHRLRPLGILFTALFLAFVFSGLSRQDRIAGLVPLIMAAGATYWDRFEYKPLQLLLFASPIVFAVVLSPVFFPILPPPQLAAYSAKLGIVPEIEAHRTPLALPQWFADRLDWESYVEAVEAAYTHLSEEEKANAVILTRNYSGAGPLEFLGRGLPPVYALQNSYHSWGPPEPFDVAIAVQFSQHDLSRYFGSVSQVGEFQCTYCRQWRSPTPVYVVARPKRPIAEMWSELGFYK